MSKKGQIYNRYDAELKIEVAEAVISKKMTCEEADAEFGISKGRAASWSKIYAKQGPDGLRSERRGRPKRDKLSPKAEREEQMKRKEAKKEYDKCVSEGSTKRERAQIIRLLRPNHRLQDLLAAAEMSHPLYYYYINRYEDGIVFPELRSEIDRIYKKLNQNCSPMRIARTLSRRGKTVNTYLVRLLMKDMYPANEG